MATTVDSSRIALAKLIKNAELHLAWGTGLTAWDTTPVQPTSNDTDLVAEIGRRKVSVVEYCVPDAEGAIEVTSGRYSSSVTPSSYLYMSFNFSIDDAPTAVIREVGLFVGAVLASHPDGQMYFDVADVAEKGQLFLVNRFEPLHRSTTIRQYFEFVISL